MLLPEPPPNLGKTPLHRAVIYEEFDETVALLNAGVDVDAPMGFAQKSPRYH